MSLCLFRVQLRSHSTAICICYVIPQGKLLQLHQHDTSNLTQQSLLLKFVLQEREYKFSVAPDLNRFLAAGLGVLNQ
jgi:hypothetical protein